LLNALYLKEIDQEENVWRSLPFFSATLAVEVVVLNQVLPLAAGTSGLWWWALLAAGVALSGMIFSILVFLYRSIRRRSFSYIASGKDLVGYVRALETAERAVGWSPGEAEGVSGPAIADQLRETLIGQLAAATDANRLINQSRAAERTRAGILLLASIVTTSVFVGVTIGHDMTKGLPRGSGHGAREREASSSPPGTRSGAGDKRGVEPSGAGRTPEDAGRQQRLELPRKPPDAGAGGGADP
jgi:hypothetical protein